MKKRLIIGSRGSKLALRQAEIVSAQITKIHSSLEVVVEVIKTTGDVKPDPLSIIGGKGVFTKELEDALLDDRIDLAIHSLKDLPTTVPDQLSIAAICEREDPRDALISAAGDGLTSVPAAAVVGTSSRRRLAQLRHQRPDLVFKDIRGNVDTRLRKLDEGQYDVLVLAYAGLKRLGMEHRVSEVLSIEQMLPAVGQGAIAVEVRASDASTINLLAPLDHPPTRFACMAERAFLRTLGGGCELPIAAYGQVSDGRLRIDGLVSDFEGNRIVRDQLIGELSDAEELGRRLAHQLLELGAAKLLIRK